MKVAAPIPCVTELVNNDVKNLADSGT